MRELALARSATRKMLQWLSSRFAQRFSSRAVPLHQEQSRAFRSQRFDAASESEGDHLTNGRPGITTTIEGRFRPPVVRSRCRWPIWAAELRRLHRTSSRYAIQCGSSSSTLLQRHERSTCSVSAHAIGVSQHAFTTLHSLERPMAGASSLAMVACPACSPHSTTIVHERHHPTCSDVAIVPTLCSHGWHRPSLSCRFLTVLRERTYQIFVYPPGIPLYLGSRPYDHRGS